MSERVEVKNLVGTAEIAQRLGMKRPQIVHDWRRRYEDFPKPIAVVSGVHVWNWPTIEKWAKATGRL